MLGLMFIHIIKPLAALSTFNVEMDSKQQR